MSTYRYKCDHCGQIAEEVDGHGDPIHDLGSCTIEAELKKEMADLAEVQDPEYTCDCPYCDGELVDYDCRCFFEGGCSAKCIHNNDKEYDDFVMHPPLI